VNVVLEALAVQRRRPAVVTAGTLVVAPSRAMS